MNKQATMLVTLCLIATSFSAQAFWPFSQEAKSTEKVAPKTPYQIFTEKHATAIATAQGLALIALTDLIPNPKHDGFLGQKARMVGIRPKHFNASAPYLAGLAKFAVALLAFERLVPALNTLENTAKSTWLKLNNQVVAPGMIQAQELTGTAADAVKSNTKKLSTAVVDPSINAEQAHNLAH